ncbi:MAG TPA: hypothetical protein VGL89_08375 [Candidatus Koribacter sp.]|jgi:hypothetical protein
MKKLIAIALLALAGCVCAVAQQATQAQPSLGDVARKQRAQDDNAPKTKVWTNDDFPDSPAPVAEPKGDAADADKTKGEPKDKSEAKDKDGKAAAGDQDALNKEWQGKVDAEKAKIADLQREYDLTDREYKLFATDYYADAGNRLRDQKDFHDKEQGYRDKIGTLKDQISAEQAKLADLQDQAHKAGAATAD